jgi:cellobiose-specific phosphotransferase system component IIA
VLTVRVDTFSKDVAHIAERWPDGQWLNDKDRKKAASDVARLVNQGKILRNSVVSFTCRLVPGQKDSATRQLKDAWRRLQSIDLAQRLQKIIETLDRIHNRLRETFSPQVMAAINGDFHTLTTNVSRLNTEAGVIQSTLQHVLPEAGLNKTMIAALSNLIEAITKAITGTTDGKDIGDTFLDHGRFSARLPERLKRVSAISTAYKALNAAFEKECDDRLKALLGREPQRAIRFENFLSTVRQVIHTVSSTHEFVQTTVEAASQGVDHEVSTQVKELRDHLASVQLASDSLHEMVERYSDIVARAPFKRSAQSKPMPGWQRLSQDEQDVLALLITARATAPEGELYSVARKTLEQELGLDPNDSTLNRSLKDLDQEHEIVGKYVSATLFL